MEPAPPHSWASLTPSIAAVDAATGFVYGITPGTATIQLTSGDKTAAINIDISGTGCSLATTPSGIVNTKAGLATSVTATARCFGGAVLPSGNWIWPTTGPIQFNNDDSQNSRVHFVATSGGTGTTKVCTPAGTNQICSAPMTFNVFGVTAIPQVTGVQQVGPNSSGSFPVNVTNTGPIAGTATLSCGSFGRVSCTGLTPSSVALAIGETKTITANWTSGTLTGAGEVTIAGNGSGSAVDFNVIGGPMTTSINYGPSSVRPGVNCEWMASANGGTPPYTYQWTVNGDPASGSGNDLYYVNLRRNFTLGITTTDANGVTATDSKAITVTSSAPYCPL